MCLIFRVNLFSFFASFYAINDDDWNGSNERDSCSQLTPNRRLGIGLTYCYMIGALFLEFVHFVWEREELMRCQICCNGSSSPMSTREFQFFFISHSNLMWSRWINHIWTVFMTFFTSPNETIEMIQQWVQSVSQSMSLWILTKAKALRTFIRRSSILSPDTFCGMKKKNNRRILAYNAIIVVLVTHSTWRNNILFHF